MMRFRPLDIKDQFFWLSYSHPVVALCHCKLYVGGRCEPCKLAMFHSVDNDLIVEERYDPSTFTRLSYVLPTRDRLRRLIFTCPVDGNYWSDVFQAEPDSQPRKYFGPAAEQREEDDSKEFMVTVARYMHRHRFLDWDRLYLDICTKSVTEHPGLVNYSPTFAGRHPDESKESY